MVSVIEDCKMNFQRIILAQRVSGRISNVGRPFSKKQVAYSSLLSRLTTYEEHTLPELAPAASREPRPSSTSTIITTTTTLPISIHFLASFFPFPFLFFACKPAYHHRHTHPTIFIVEVFSPQSVELQLNKNVMS